MQSLVQSGDLSRLFKTMSTVGGGWEEVTGYSRAIHSTLPATKRPQDIAIYTLVLVCVLLRNTNAMDKLTLEHLPKMMA